MILNGKLELENKIKTCLYTALTELAEQKGKQMPSDFDMEMEVPKDTSFGDLSTNTAMKLAKAFQMNPRALAEELLSRAGDIPYVDESSVAGPGFINFRVSHRFLEEELAEILVKREDYGTLIPDEPKTVNVEFVSANPTGPLHIGNARGGAIGDVIANIFRKAGWKVTKEFYLNDAGNQVVKFGESLYARFMQQDDPDYPMPENAYLGDDITLQAKAFRELNPGCEKWDRQELTEKMCAYSLEANIDNMHKVLSRYGIEYDVWFRESGLHEKGLINDAIAMLREHGAVYEKDGALWFRATDYDCEKDEVLVRSNGIPTYYAADIAYHLNKLVTRGFDQSVNVWGADHHGHVHRLKMALKACGLDPARLDIILMQLVHLVRGNESVRLSKRRGDAVTLDELLSEVPVDAVRYIFNTSTPNSHMEFDLDLAVKQSNDNPVFYVQYAHARICSILRNIQYTDAKADYSLLTDKTETALMMKMTDFSQEVMKALDEYDPSKITKYAFDLASLLHSFYNVCRVKNDDPALQNARLDLVTACGCVLRSALGILGVSAPSEM